MNGNLVLTNGKIYLEKEKFAEAMLVLDGKVAAVGTNEEIAAKAPEGVRVYDCKGRTVVPGFNDSEAEMEELAGTLAGIDPEITLHVTRFFPAGEMKDTPPTPVQTVINLAETARARLKYVYTGNI